MNTTKILIINGPNLNLLGTREPEIYGELTLEKIQEHTQRRVKDLPVVLEWYQSNIEGEIVERIQQAPDKFDALIINPAAYSHTSVAILDALKMLKLPIVEVHISNTNKREEFRKVKLTAQASSAVIEGMGKDGYWLAITAIVSQR